MEEKKEKIELSDPQLDEVVGGIEETRSYYRSHFTMISPPTYCCPQCSSWNVINYDPGDLRVMRIYCADCGYVGERGNKDSTSKMNPYKGWNKIDYHFPD